MYSVLSWRVCSDQQHFWVSALGEVSHGEASPTTTGERADNLTAANTHLHRALSALKVLYIYFLHQVWSCWDVSLPLSSASIFQDCIVLSAGRQYSEPANDLLPRVCTPASWVFHVSCAAAPCVPLPAYCAPSCHCRFSCYFHAGRPFAMWPSVPAADQVRPGL